MPPLTARFRQGRSIRHAAGHAHGCGARDRPRAWMSNMALAFLWAKSGQHVKHADRLLLGGMFPRAG